MLLECFITTPYYFCLNSIFTVDTVQSCLTPLPSALFIYFHPSAVPEDLLPLVESRSYHSPMTSPGYLHSPVLPRLLIPHLLDSPNSSISPNSPGMCFSHELPVWSSSAVVPLPNSTVVACSAMVVPCFGRSSGVQPNSSRWLSEVIHQNFQGLLIHQLKPDPLFLQPT